MQRDLQWAPGTSRPNFTFQLLFVVLMIATLIPFLRERSFRATPGA